MNSTPLSYKLLVCIIMDWRVILLRMLADNFVGKGRLPYLVC